MTWSIIGFIVVNFLTLGAVAGMIDSFRRLGTMACMDIEHDLLMDGLLSYVLIIPAGGISKQECEDTFERYSEKLTQLKERCEASRMLGKKITLRSIERSITYTAGLLQSVVETYYPEEKNDIS